MFSTLPASAARTSRSASAIAWSLAVHFAVITSAARLAASDVEDTPASPPQDTTLVYLPSPERPTTGRTSGNEGSGGPARAPSTPIGLPAPPVTVPTELPPIDSTMPVIDGNADWLAEAARRTLTNGGDSTGSASGSRPGGGALAVAERGAVALPGNPRPRYPEVVRAAAVEGAVVAEFVVDTSGRVEMGSVLIIESSQPLFEAAVLDVLSGLRFLPAEAGGRKVRQIVRQPFRFRLGDREPALTPRRRWM